MIAGREYLQEVQKFTSSQYWHSGWKITAGVMLPLFVFIIFGWVTVAVPFLWGALFVSLTDTPGPVHHRRNGMIAAILLNTVVVLLTTITRAHPGLLVGQIVVLCFFLTMLGVYGARASAVGTLALVVMLLNMLSINQEYNTLQGSLLIGAGGCWYMLFSLMLHGIRPYRAVEQALGEHLIAIGSYIRARATFYREGADLTECFHRVMTQQSEVRAIQSQTQELLFETRRFLRDASPRSRALMMIFLDSLDLFEETMYNYQNYEDLQKSLKSSGLLNRYYGLILEVAAGVEYIGMTVQAGKSVKKDFDVTRRISDIKQKTEEELQARGGREQTVNQEALIKILNNVQEISNRLNRLILYTRMEGDMSGSFEAALKISRHATTQPLDPKLLIDNLTFNSDIFRHAIRLTVAIIAGYSVSVLLSLDHSYWVLLTIVTILRPAYVLTKKRNIERVAGTLVGVIAVSIILSFVSNDSVLLGILLLSMLLGYSLLRVHYFTFVVFLTIFVVISLYFLNPVGFQSLIVERLVDTLIGSIIAFVASRFIFPVWGHREIKTSMQKMLEANRQYFLQAWQALKTKGSATTTAYALARQDAIVCLTNLSDNFQSMLSEPEQSAHGSHIHQFVIANHMLTGHIAALSDESFPPGGTESTELEDLSKAISNELQSAEDNLRHTHSKTDLSPQPDKKLSMQSLTQMSIIFDLAHDIRKISARMQV